MIANMNRRMLVVLGLLGLGGVREVAAASASGRRWSVAKLACARR